MAIEKPYVDIPGTTVFDAAQSRKGYWLNQFCMSLMQADNRERFKRDERAYLDEWDMTEDQKQSVLDRDMNRMIALGGNIYFLAKIGATDGLSFQQMAGSMTGMSEDEYRAMMVAGGRSIEGNRYIERAGPADGAHLRIGLHVARAGDRRRARPRQDRRAVLAAAVRRVRTVQGVDARAHARRRLPRLQRSRHRVQSRDDPDVRDRHRGVVRRRRRRLGAAPGARRRRSPGPRCAHRPVGHPAGLRPHARQQDGRRPRAHGAALAHVRPARRVAVPGDSRSPSTWCSIRRRRDDVA